MKERASRIPLEILFGHPTRYAPQISPDGRSLAFTAAEDGELYLWRRDVETEIDTRLVSVKGFRALAPIWSLDSSRLLYLQDSKGNEVWHLFCCDTDTGETVDVTPFKDITAQLVGVSRRHPSTVLVELNKDDRSLFDVYSVDLKTGHVELTAKNPGHVSAMQPDRQSWFADLDLTVRARTVSDEHGGYFLEILDGTDGDWRSVRHWDLEDSRNSRPLVISADGRWLYCIDSLDFNAGRLTACDLDTGEFEVLYEDPGYDVDIVAFHPLTKTPQAVGADRDRLTWVVLDPALRDDFELLQSDKDSDFYLGGRDDADSRWIVAKVAADVPTSFHLYDRQKKTVSLLWESQPELSSFQLAEVRPYSFKARDGLEINGYITLPPSPPAGPMPTVLFPHGGPWERDFWLLNPFVQFLANRGYAVLQVNFRGSTGYGKDFVNAGNREWGGKMHDDLIDAVEWAISQGHSDRERLAIFGGSFGGYAALVGATFTPDYFRCVVDMFGWSDLVAAMKSLPESWKERRSQWFRRVGDPYSEAEFLWSRSPLSRIDQLKVPLLIAQGTEDVRVKKEASDRLVQVLEEKGIPHEYMVFEGEGHFFTKPENWIKFFEAVEEFLAEHL